MDGTIVGPLVPKLESKDAVIEAIIREANIAKEFADTKPVRVYNTGFNGKGGANAVVDETTLKAIEAEWKEKVNDQCQIPKFSLRSAYSATEGKLAPGRMHDFLYERSQGPAIMNFHIEVWGRK